jgi:chitodextrinase
MKRRCLAKKFLAVLLLLAFTLNGINPLTAYAAKSKGDRISPSAPANLRAVTVTDTSVTLTWSASTDNIAVTGYQIYQNYSLIGRSAATTFIVSGLTPSTTYKFTVKAVDAAGNTSSYSSVLTVITAVKAPTATP